jgi:hypothetical protein
LRRPHKVGIISTSPHARRRDSSLAGITRCVSSSGWDGFACEFLVVGYVVRKRQMSGVVLQFEPLDELKASDAKSLIEELQAAGSEASVTETLEFQPLFDPLTIVSVITVTTASIAALAVVAGFLERTFRRGVYIDLRHRPPKILENTAVPRGALLIIYSDGREELHEGISSQQMGDLMHAALSAHADSDQDLK